MKHKGITQPQKIRVELWNLVDIPVRYQRGIMSSLWGPYRFAESPIILEDDFSPINEWATLLEPLIRFYRTLCSHLGVQTIDDTTIKSNICSILRDMRELHIYYSIL